MKVLTIFIVYLAASLSACAATNPENKKVTMWKPDLKVSQNEKWKLMTGKWYGSQPTEQGGKKDWISIKTPVGTYKVIFRMYQKGSKEYKEQTEVGYWGISGPVYFTIFRGWVEGKSITPSDPGDPYNYDAYKIIKLTKDSFQYTHYDTGNSYIVRKVPDDFEFPK